MITIIVLPTKPADKNYPYFKCPNKVLEISDSEVEKLITGTPGVYHLKHYANDMDKMSDKEIMEYFNKTMQMDNVTILSKHTANGYSTEEKRFFVRIIRS